MPGILSSSIQPSVSFESEDSVMINSGLEVGNLRKCVGGTDLEIFKSFRTRKELDWPKEEYELLLKLVDGVSQLLPDRN
jgi:hypothetical protein